MGCDSPRAHGADSPGVGLRIFRESSAVTYLGLAFWAYLLGSLPFGWLLCWWVAGIDLRTVGSGNIGATNASRVLGKTWGSVVLLLDALKGLLPVWLLPLAFELPPETVLHGRVLAGVSAIVGHSFPVWLGFRGGKGVATSLGVALILAPQATLLAAVIFATVMLSTRIVSAGSLAAAVGFALCQWYLLQPQPWSGEKWSLSGFSLGVPLLIVIRHRSNIVRLWRGEEQPWRAGKAPQAPSATDQATPAMSEKTKPQASDGMETGTRGE